ncbi:MAG: LLM class flavin-dependent oxidoreductase [Candidatus Caldarchaeum sp.]|nr:LLM class flavin-dependent oxidoreductase [Candidatus Caldarchaeum sp.]
MRPIGLSYVTHTGPITSGELVQSAVYAEKHGYHSVWVPELYYNRECHTLMGAMAAETKKIKLASSVVNPITRSPSLIAMSVATLDEYSGGRAILGLGSGGRIGAAVHGIPPEHKGVELGAPVRRLRECITLVRRLLAGEKVNFEGEFYNLDYVSLEFKPRSKKIPIYLGQQGPMMMRLTGQVADGVILTIVSSEKYVREAVSQIRQGADEAGRNPDEIHITSRIVVSMSRDGRKAKKTAKMIVGKVLVHPGSAPVIEASGIDLDEIKPLRLAVDKNKPDEIEKHVKNEWVDMLTASGTPAECRERLEEYRKAGVQLPLVVPIGKNYLEIIKEMVKDRR